jgi:hypothetical protein
MGWFGPSKDDVWRELCRETGAEFVEGEIWKGNKVQARVEPWTITLDAFTGSNGESSHTYIRMRAPYVNPEGFRFTIYRKGVFTELGKLLGMQDPEIGAPDFDEAFVIKGERRMEAAQALRERRGAAVDREPAQGAAPGEGQ